MVKRILQHVTSKILQGLCLLCNLLQYVILPWLMDIQIRRHVDFIRDILAVFLALPDAFGQEVFNLAVDGAEIILCPGCDCVIELFGQP